MANLYAVRGPDGTNFYNTAGETELESWLSFKKFLTETGSYNIPSIDAALKAALLGMGFEIIEYNATEV